MIGFILDVERHSAAAQHERGKNTQMEQNVMMCARESTRKYGAIEIDTWHTWMEY